MTAICLHCFISGRVQGVFYRRETQRQAQRQGVQGWVRNLDDGRVEALLCGEREVVEALRDWLWQGPPAAKVIAVEVEELPCQHLTQFEMR